MLKINGAQGTFIKNDKGEVTAVIHHMAGCRIAKERNLTTNDRAIGKIH
jgi:hypothetical protein